MTSFHATSFPEMERPKPNADFFFQLCCMLLSMKMHICINEKIEKEEERPEKGKRKKKAPIVLTNEKKTAFGSILIADVSFCSKTYIRKICLEKTQINRCV